MKVTPCAIAGPLLIEPKVHGDERGYFFESWNARDFAAAGLDLAFVQENESLSQKGVLRGLHFQHPQAQGKLVRVASGSVYDVAVDLRRSSPDFGKWVAVELSAANKRSFWVPEGFGHGFLALEDDTRLIYKCTALYAPQHEHVLAWDDPDLAIAWPLEGRAPIMAEKDQSGSPLSDIAAFP